MPSDATSLPTNNDATYADDASDPTVKIHQQLHDAHAAFSNTHPTDIDPHGDQLFATNLDTANRAWTATQISNAVIAAGTSLQVGSDGSLYIDIASAGSAPSPVGTITVGTITGTRVNLSWAAASGATSYTVEAKTSSGTTWSPFGTVTGTTVTVTGLTRETAYNFRVTAFNTTGAAAPSTPANATTIYRPLLGWSANDIPGMTNEIVGTWMARDTYQRLARGEWLPYDTDYNRYMANKVGGGAADIGVPLVPWDLVGKSSAEMGGTSVTSLDQLYDYVTANGALTGVSDNSGVAVTTTDAMFTAMGKRLAVLGPAKCYLRVQWEYNLQTFTGSKFIAAWQRAIPLIRSGFAAAAATGQTMQVVFCPSLAGAGTNWASFYPGDAYVDIIGVDAYGQVWGTTTPSQSTLLASVNGSLNEISTFAAAHSKGVSMGEWGNMAIKTQGVTDSQGRGDEPAYIDAVLTWARTNRAVYLCYYNTAAIGVGQTLANTPNSLTHLLAAV